MSRNRRTRTESIRPLALAALALPFLLAACATGVGPSPDQPATPAPVEPPVPAEPPAAAVPAEPSATDPAPAAESSPIAAYLEDPTAITAGRRMFRAVCTGYCHSTTAGVTKDAPNLFDCNWDHGSTDADLYRVITQGVPDTEMLPFDGKIPEETIWQVIAYIRSNSMECG